LLLVPASWPLFVMPEQVGIHGGGNMLECLDSRFRECEGIPISAPMCGEVWISAGGWGCLVWAPSERARCRAIRFAWLRHARA
jgi:hypothetical protein